MRDLRVAAAQFEHRDCDRTYNLNRIRELTQRAVAQGAELVCFHECSTIGYTSMQRMSREELEAWSEPVPDGPTVGELVGIAREHGVFVTAGLIERGDDGKLYNCYVAVGPAGYLGKFRKINEFVSPYLSLGDFYTVIDLGGVKVGFLTCYDNNLPENVRITALMGAEVIVMPHVTGGTASDMPGRGLIDRKLWENRHEDPVRLRLEFDGLKGRSWVLRWLPARCWENGVYAVFTNALGVDDDTIKPGGAMLFDPHGEILAESREVDDDVVVATLTKRGFETASGRRYLAARRPELYGKLVEPRPAGQTFAVKPGWRMAHEDR